MKVLLVDDDPDILAILAAGLDLYGSHKIEKATSGEDALRLVHSAQRPFDLFLFDIQMPEMTGIELCRLIRAFPEYQHTPIVMITAMTDKPYIDESFLAGATDYISKPIDFTDLRLRISLAEKAVLQAKRVANAAQIEHQTDLSYPPRPTVALSDAIPISDVDGVLSVHAFENYLAQLGRLQFRSTRLQILTVKNIASLYGRCIPREFVDVVTDIAECISDALHGYAPLIAYFGRGVFGIAYPTQNLRSIDDICADIEQRIDKTEPIFRDGCPVPIDLELVDISRKIFFFPKSQAIYVRRISQELQHATHFGATFP